MIVSSGAMIGPWRFEDWESFLQPWSDALAHPAPCQQPPPAWRKHPIYTWLAAKTAFSEALKLFQRARAKARNDTPDEAEHAEFVFAQIWAICGYFAFTEPQWQATGYRFSVTADKRMKAIRALTGVWDLFAQGVMLDDDSKQLQLEALLRELVLKLATTRRAQYEGRRAAERKMLRGFARLLWERLGVASPAIVMRFAEVFGLPCDARRAQRYCAEAKAHKAPG
ncbi:MAG TPA: hypothetical protein VF193_01055 [Steroidobacter sp.]